MSGIALKRTASAEPQRSRMRAIERVISTILRYGVYASLALIGLGVLLMAVHGQTGYGPVPAPESLMTPGPVAWPHTVGAVFTGLLTARPYALILTGLLLLMATPVLQVAVSGIAFLVQRDYAFAIIAAFVLGVLLLSFLLGAVEGHV